MTIDVELLPTPSVLLNWPHPTNHVAIRDYARACVAHATAAKDTKIEALRVEVAAQRARADAMAGEAIKHEARAERLAEALRLYMSAGFGNSTDFYKQAEAKRAATEVLHPTAAQDGK